MAAEDKHKTVIIVRELHEIRRGRTSRGTEFVLNQVVATRQDGRPIEQNLRTFDNLPKNEPIEVTVEKFKMEGSDALSFTVTLAGRSGGMNADMAEIRKRLDRVEQMLGIAPETSSNAAASPPPPPPPTAEPAPPPAPSAAPAGEPPPTDTYSQKPPMANAGAGPTQIPPPVDDTPPF